MTEQRWTVTPALVRLAEFPQWVNWKRIWRGDEATKPPFTHDWRNASSTNPMTWSSFEVACHAVPTPSHEKGIGFVLSTGDPFCGIDVDGCRNPTTGEITDWGLTIIHHLDSYTEVSPSGTGVKVFIEGTLPQPGRKIELTQQEAPSPKHPALEIYASGRYFTVTGWHLEGTPQKINKRQTEIDSLFDHFFAGANGTHVTDEAVASHVNQVSGGMPSPGLSDAEVLQLAFDAKNGARIRALYNDGDLSAYGEDDSRADQALCNFLVFYTGSDLEQLWRLIAASALYRPKWERQDYRDRTFMKALMSLSTVYRRSSPAPADAPASGKAKPAREPMHWMNTALLATIAEEEITWFVHGFVGAGLMTELDGKVKSSGKTTLALAMLRAILQREEFLGKPTVYTSIVYLTEQSAGSFRRTCDRGGVLDRVDMDLLLYNETRDYSWTEIVGEAVRYAQSVRAGLLVVDTLSQFSGIRGEAENSSGAAMEVMDPLHLATAAGLAVLLIRHDRKSGGDVGDSARGSSAYAGSVDIILRLMRVPVPGNGHERERLLEGLSRLEETPDKVLLELSQDKPYSYRLLGDPEVVRDRVLRARILEVLPLNAEDGLGVEDIIDIVGVRDIDVRRMLRTLVTERLIQRSGKGKSGDPYRYSQHAGLDDE
jgi:hypothetical protein